MWKGNRKFVRNVMIFEVDWEVRRNNSTKLYAYSMERARPPIVRNVNGDKVFLRVYASFEDGVEYPESVAFLDSKTWQIISKCQKKTKLVWLILLTFELFSEHFPDEHAMLLFTAMMWAVLGSMGLGVAEAVRGWSGCLFGGRDETQHTCRGNCP